MSVVNQMVAVGCLKGSAWHVWQQVGYAWQLENPAGDRNSAADLFAAATDLPAIAHESRRQAFLEGAKAASWESIDTSV